MPVVRGQCRPSPASRARLQCRQLPAHAGDARADQGLVADQPEREADQDRREGRQPRPLCRLPDGRGRRAEDAVRRDPAADRRTAATVAANPGMSIGSNNRWQPDGRGVSMNDRELPNADKTQSAVVGKTALRDLRGWFEPSEPCLCRRNGIWPTFGSRHPGNLGLNHRWRAPSQQRCATVGGRGMAALWLTPGWAVRARRPARMRGAEPDQTRASWCWSRLHPTGGAAATARMSICTGSAPGGSTTCCLAAAYRRDHLGLPDWPRTLGVRCDIDLWFPPSERPLLRSFRAGICAA